MRWNHLGNGYEASVSLYDGHNHLPLFEGDLSGVRRYYPHLRLIGADAVVPLRWFSVKSEGAWFTSKTTAADEYVLYVVQLERQFGETSIVGGYSGEAVTRRRNPFDFAPDRWLARSFLGRIGHTIGPRRGIASE